jgi:hypothetical protein
MNGEQLTLFKQPVISRKLDDHLLVPKKIETFMPEIVPGKYIIYPTGGWHLFHKQAPKGSIYTKPIWPFITTNSGHNKVKKVATYFSDSTNYMMVSLLDKNHLDKNHLPTTCPKMMHVIVARAYIENKDPEKYYQVAHKGDDKCNYLPENLEWKTGSGNHTGKKNKRISSREEDYLFAKSRGFIL